jgi:hypothetical protein
MIYLSKRMNILRISRKIYKRLLLVVFIFVFFINGIPSALVNKWADEMSIVDIGYWLLKDSDVIDNKLGELLQPTKVKAATFTMQTGVYVGDGVDGKAISNIGFQPNLVLIKDNTIIGDDGMLWKSSSMGSEITSKLGEAEADIATNAIQSLTSTGFTVGSDDDINTVNEPYYWTAFGGSDCSSSGTFCVGSYTGNGTSQSITSVGFQPDLVVVKGTGLTAPVWKSSSMATNTTQYMSNVVENTGGQMIQALTATGFNIGNQSVVNTGSTTYWYFAFKQVSGAMDVGSYTGSGVDARTVTTTEDAGLNFQANMVFTKRAQSSGAYPVYNFTESYGDRSAQTGDVAMASNHIQRLIPTGGFEVGTASNSNLAATLYYYAAFGGISARSGTGTYEMAKGSYTGNGTSQSVTGLTFQPDLVIIKHHDQATDQYAVFRTKDMKGDSTAYFAVATVNFTGGITSLNSDGFSVGSNATVNTSSDTYYWTAYGNAWDMEDFSGAADFMVGFYVGDGQDNRDVNFLPFEPDLLVVKRSNATARVGVWRTSSMPADGTSFFAATAGGSNVIQAFNSDGFQKGSGADANGGGGYHFYFMFKTSANFYVGTYTGNGTSQNVTGPNFQPDLIFTKKYTGGTARGALLRNASQAGDVVQAFLNTATVTGRITAILSTGFSVGSGVEANESTGVFYYTAWKIPVAPSGTLSVDIVDSGGTAVGSPSVAFSSVDTSFSCQTSTATLGVTAQKIRVNNDSATPGWSLTIAADAGVTDTWDDVSEHYDFNDTGGSPSGCTDSGDADSYGGRMTFDFSSATITPEAGCTNTGVAFGSNTGFSQGTTDSVTVVTASGSAGTSCYWDITGIVVTQRIPAEQGFGNYAIPMTLTVVAN